MLNDIQGLLNETLPNEEVECLTLFLKNRQPKSESGISETEAAETGAERADDVADMLPSNIKPETFYAFIDRYEKELGVTFDHDKRLKIAESVKTTNAGFLDDVVVTFDIAKEIGIIDDSYAGVLTRDLVQKYKSESKNFTEVLIKIDQSGEYPLYIFLGSGMNHFAYPLYENGVHSGTLLIEPDARPAIILYQTGPDAPEEILCSESDFAN